MLRHYLIVANKWSPNQWRRYVKTYSDPSYIFSWGHDPYPRIYAPGPSCVRLVSSQQS